MEIQKLYKKEIKDGIITKQEAVEIQNYLKGSSNFPSSSVKLLNYLKEKNPYFSFINENPSYQKVIIKSAEYSKNQCSVTTFNRKKQYHNELIIYRNQIELLLKTKYLITLNAEPKRGMIISPSFTSKIEIKIIEFFKRIINGKSI